MFLAIFGSLALVVASLGIVNTLVMAILERRREIGILKALGAADRDVRMLFFVEAGAMGLLGGVLGVLIGWLIGARDQFRHQRLPGSPGATCNQRHRRALVDGRARDHVFNPREPRRRNVSRIARGAARSRPGLAI